MGDYTGRIDIARPPAEVFAFLADIRNMPRYLPTVTHVGPLGHHDDHDDVAVEGKAEGHDYRNDGWMKAEPETRRLRWGSHTMQDYHGGLEVQAAPGGAIVVLQLSLTPKPEVVERLQREHGSVDSGMRQALDRTLASIKDACERGDATRDSANGEDAHDDRPFGSSAAPSQDR
jgi:hypothetical protein